MKLIAALLTLTLLTTFCHADEVTDLVTQIPVRDSAAEDALAAKLMKGGAPAVKELAGMLVPLGTQEKDDTKVRDAFSALVRHAGHSESDRAALVKGICEGIESASDPEVKTFLVNRLQTVGHDDAVPTLAPLLADEKLGLHACMALERIGSAAAIDEIAKALPQAKGALRVAMIKSLGSLGASFVAAAVVLPVCYAVQSRRSGPPVPVTFLPTFWLLVPGALGLQGVAQIIGADQAAGLGDFLNALMSVVAIAVGVLVGSGISERLGRATSTWRGI